MNGVNIALGYGLGQLRHTSTEKPTLTIRQHHTWHGVLLRPYGQAQWRGPLGIALLWPFMMLLIIFLPFVPESPRFLLMRGRVDEARDVTLKLHSMKGDHDNEFARAEFYQVSMVLS